MKLRELMRTTLVILGIVAFFGSYRAVNALCSSSPRENVSTCGQASSVSCADGTCNSDGNYPGTEYSGETLIDGFTGLTPYSEGVTSDGTDEVNCYRQCQCSTDELPEYICTGYFGACVEGPDSCDEIFTDCEEWTTWDSIITKSCTVTPDG